MGIREAEYNRQSKEQETAIICNKISDARRFFNKNINYFDKKAINKIKINIYINYNDRKFED